MQTFQNMIDRGMIRLKMEMEDCGIKFENAVFSRKHEINENGEMVLKITCTDKDHEKSIFIDVPDDIKSTISDYEV